MVHLGLVRDNGLQAVAVQGLQTILDIQKQVVRVAVLHIQVQAMVTLVQQILEAAVADNRADQVVILH